jgi:uncharacterized protein
LKPIIPDAALGQHIAVLGKTGSGKTFAAKASIVEPLLELGRRVSVVDPTGAWWGLRSSRDGKGPGFPVIVLGGDHGDLPLPANGGAAVARLITEQGVNLVADTSQLTMGESARWFTEFAGTLYRSNRSPLHLVIDEAHNFAPQGKVPDPDTGKMLHAANKLASGGRSRGIRLVMITQRPQKLHKDTLTSADTLIAMRVLAPQDREAVEGWIKGCGDREHGKEVLNSLASLQRGEGWVWYPEGVHLKRARFPEIRTFDSSATPTDGGTIAAPKGAAEVDLAEIRAALAEAVKEAEANDPKLLRAEISKLKAELAKKPAAVVTPASPSKEGLAHVREQALREGYYQGLRAVQPIADRLTTLSAAIAETAAAFQHDLKRLATKTPAVTKAPPQGPAGSAGARVSRTPAAAAAPSEGFTGPEQRVLDALAWWRAIGVERPDKGQVGFMAGYRVGKNVGGTFGNILGTLRARGYLDYPSTGAAALTDKGLGVARPPATDPTTADLHRAIFDRLDGPEQRVLQVLIDSYPDAITKQECGGRSGYTVGDNVGGTFGNILGRLRSLGLIDYPSAGHVVALPVLFLEAR